MSASGADGDPFLAGDLVRESDLRPLWCQLLALWTRLSGLYLGRGGVDPSLESRDTDRLLRGGELRRRVRLSDEGDRLRLKLLLGERRRSDRSYSLRLS